MHAANTLSIIRRIVASRAAMRKIADELTSKEIKTARGSLWYEGTMRIIVAQKYAVEV